VFTKKRIQKFISLTTAVGVFLVAAAAQAQIYVTDDATINSYCDSWVIVGKDSSGNNFSPSVTFDTGARTFSNVYSHNSSRIKMLGGDISGRLFLKDNSTASISGGNVFDGIDAYGTSRVLVNGGYVGNYLSLRQSNYAKIESGTVVNAYVAGNSSLDMVGGGIHTNLIVADSGLARVYDGTMYEFQAEGGNALLYGGRTTWLSCETNGTATMYGGSAEYLGVFGEAATLNVLGGSFTQYIKLVSGTLNLYGTGIYATLVNDNYRLWGWDCNQYVLSGVLQDGTNISGKYLYAGDQGKINVVQNSVPAPGAILGFLVGLVTLKRRKALCR